MKVSVITPVLDEEAHLRETIAGMQAQDVDGPVEFLLVDGGSTDASRAIIAAAAAEDPRFRLLENPRRKIPFALNIGLRAAQGEYVARMDAHTRYPPGYLRLGIERLAQGDVVSVSGPQIAVGDGRGWSDRSALALSVPLGVGGAAFRRAGDGAEFPVDTGFTGLWRRDVLLAAGGWDEEWITDEDCELAFRLAADGGRHVCLPAMAAEYRPRDSVAALRRQYWQYGLHKIKTFRRHPMSMRTSHLLPPLVSAAIFAAPFSRNARAGAAVYAAAVVATALVALARGAKPRDAGALPVTLPVMHLSYGAGLYAGAAREGVPVAAVRHALRSALP